jgi:hypothetical protein
MMLALGVAAASGRAAADPAPVAPAQATVAQAIGAGDNHSVILTGFVVDRYWIPTTDATVHVYTGDGRIVGTAFSDRFGAFKLRIPARSLIKVVVAAPGGDVRRLRSEVSNLSLGCLQDPSR